MGSAASKPEQTAQHDEQVNEKQLNERVQALSIRVSEPASVDGSLTLDLVRAWESKASQDSKKQLIRTIFAQTDFVSTLRSRPQIIADPHVFNLSVDFKSGPITNQKSSGRCWLFATTNVFRYNVMQKLNLENFQLSQSYLFVCDKLDKCNYYLELAIELADKPIDDRTVVHLANEPISDGGQWDMALNLLEKYGVMPQACFPETYSSSSSSPLNKFVKNMLRQHGLVLRRLHASLSQDKSLSVVDVLKAVRAKKEELMGEIYGVVTSTLGVPEPHKAFTWDYYDADDKPKRWTGTPVQFMKEFSNKKYPPSELFSLINDPRNPYSKLYTVDKLGNVWGGRPVLYVNTEIENMKNTVIKMIKAGLPVFFGCDVGQSSDRPSGILDADLYEFDNAFDIKTTLTKKDRLETGSSSMTHAMVISAVHLDEAGKPLRYKIENSWGPDAGDKGYYMMTDKWFEEYVYQIVVPKSLAPANLVAVFEKGEKVVLPPWDPMGSLA